MGSWVAWLGADSTRARYLREVSGRKCLAGDSKLSLDSVQVVRGIFVSWDRGDGSHAMVALEKLQRDCVFDVESSRGETQCEVGLEPTMSPGTSATYTCTSSPTRASNSAVPHRRLHH